MARPRPGVRLRLAPCTQRRHGGRARRDAVEALVADGASETTGAGLRQGDRPASPFSTGRASATSTASLPVEPPRRSRHCSTSIRSSRLPGSLHRQGSGAGTGKKRLRALAEWHFGGGDGYCAACPQTCAECPGRLNRPQTRRGLAGLGPRAAHERPAARDPRRGAGLGPGAGLALAAALGVPRSPRPNCCRRSRRSRCANINERMERTGMAERRVSVRLAAVGGDGLKADLARSAAKAGRRSRRSPAAAVRRARAWPRSARPPAAITRFEALSARAARRRPTCARPRRPPAAGRAHRPPTGVLGGLGRSAADIAAYGRALEISGRSTTRCSRRSAAIAAELAASARRMRSARSRPTR